MSRIARPYRNVVSVLPRSFYEHAPDIVARALLGKLVVRELESESLVGRIVEVEAYFGQEDPAAHSYVGRTARNAVLFGPPGFAYVYFIYGMYYCLNVSCEPDGQAGGVLIRALEPVEGLAAMAKLRKLPPNPKPQLLTSGPGRLTSNSREMPSWGWIWRTRVLGSGPLGVPNSRPGGRLNRTAISVSRAPRALPVRR